MLSRKVVFLGLCLGLLFVIGGYESATSQGVKPEDFYKGKNIDFTVTTAPGGTIDIFGRVLAPPLGRYTGATAIINNRRGGGGLEGYVHVYRAKPDGLTLGVGNYLSILLSKLMDEPGAAYESEKFSYLIGLGREPEIFVVAAKGPYNSMADLKTGKKLRLGSGQPADNIALATMSVIHCLDLDARLIAGSKGMAPLIMSIVQGELMGAAIPLAPALRYMEQGMVKPLFAVSGKRVATLPNVPALSELVPLKGEKSELIKMWDDTFFQSWLVFAAPEVPKDRLNFLQQTFNRMVKEPETDKQLNNVWGYKNEIILSGDELVEVTKSMVKNKEKIKRLFEKLIEQYRS